MAAVAQTILKEYGRIFAFSIPPAMMYTLIGMTLPIPLVGPMPYSPFIYLGVLVILSPFVFDDDETDGFFMTPQPNSWEKGVRLFAIKGLELLAEWTAFRISNRYNVIEDPFIHYDFPFDKKLAVFACIYLIAVMILSFLRAVIIFPWTVVTLVRTAGFQHAWAPFQKFIQRDPY